MKVYKYEAITQKIIKAYYEVYNELGTGFLESVYENAMLLELKNGTDLLAKSQVPIEVLFKTEVVGEFRADILVANKVIIELKAVSKLLPEHKAQVINYLKATKIEIGLLMNFGDKPEFKRFIFDK